MLLGHSFGLSPAAATCTSACRGCWLRSADPAQAHILEIQIFLDPVLAALAAHAALLDATEGCDLDRDHPVIDADHAHLHGLGDAEDAADVAGVEIAGEADIGVV